MGNQVRAFKQGWARPDIDYPQWDMRAMRASTWNNAVIGILTAKLLENIEVKLPQFLPKSREYWENVIREKLTHIKAVWVKAQPQMTDVGTIENPNQVEQCRITETEKRLERIRVQECRVQKFSCHLNIAKLLAAAKQTVNAEDAEIWVWLTDILKQLGLDGMSSNESVAEDNIHMVYRTKVMLWRRDIERELEIIDNQRFVDTDIYTPRGSKPVKRMRGKRSAPSAHHPVAKLPKVFYDKTWLKKQPQKFHD
ncbi:hypothetical protein JVU11DRAFT_5999 [Chiua virens]|nr:hypothetical protein JVU11DRAFT_5999 [Chiua virens]